MMHILRRGAFALLSIAFALVSIYPLARLVALLAAGPQGNHAPFLLFFGAVVVMALALVTVFGIRLVWLQTLLAAGAIVALSLLLVKASGAGAVLLSLVGILLFLMYHALGRAPDIYLTDIRFVAVGPLLYFMLFLLSYLFEELYPLRPYLGVPAAICVLMGVFSLGAQGVSIGAQTRSGDRAVPRPVRRGAMILSAAVAILLGVAFFWSRLREGVGALFSMLVGYLWQALLWLQNLFYHDPGTGEEMNIGSDEAFTIFGGGQGAVSPFWQKVVEILSYVAMVLFNIGLISIALYGLYRLTRYLVALLRRYLTWFQEEQEGFQDEEEALISWEAIGDNLRRRVAALTGRWARRERWEDFPGEAERVRFLYRQLLRHRGEDVPPDMTPNRLAAQRPLPERQQAVEELAWAYNRVRYSKHTLEPGRAGDIKRKLEEGVDRT